MRRRIRSVALAAALFALALTFATGLDLWPPIASADTPPKHLAEVFDDEFTGGAPILTSSLTPARGSKKSSTLTVGVSCATSTVFNVVFYVEDSDGAATGVGQVYSLNGGTALTAGAYYAFSIPVSDSYNINFQNTTTSRITMIVDEVEAGAR